MDTLKLVHVTSILINSSNNIRMFWNIFSSNYYRRKIHSLSPCPIFRKTDTVKKVPKESLISNKLYTYIKFTKPSTNESIDNRVQCTVCLTYCTVVDLKRKLLI